MAKRRRTIYALPYNGPPVAVKLLKSYVSFGEECIAAKVTGKGHEKYETGDHIVIGYDRIMYKTRSGRFFEVPREEIYERLRENEE